MKKIAFAVKHAPLHVIAFYGRLIEFLRQEFGEDFSVLGENDYEELEDLDGHYQIVMFCTRGAASYVSERCLLTRSFLVDHGPIHTNRAPHGKVDFEVFSSVYLQERYSSEGFNSRIRSWSGGYFLTDHLRTEPRLERQCLVYLIHNKGWLANSMEEFPFSDEATLSYLSGLADLFEVVHVVSHINAGENFVNRHRGMLPQNVIAVHHGIQFMDLIARVDAVFTEYSSVLSSCLWNSEVKIFVRYPRFATGPITMQARYLHELMSEAAYPIHDDDLAGVPDALAKDPLRSARDQAKERIFDPAISDPYAAIARSLREALRLVD